MLRSLMRHLHDLRPKSRRHFPDQARLVEVMVSRLAALPAKALEQGEPLADPNDFAV